MNQRKLIDLQSLGIEYTVLDAKGQEVDKVRVIEHDEILHCGAGYLEDYEGLIEEYLGEHVSSFEGFVENPFCVSWYCTSEEEFDIMNAVIVALQQNNNIVIIEHIDTGDTYT